MATFDLSDLDKIRDMLDDCDSEIDLQTLATDLLDALEDSQASIKSMREQLVKATTLRNAIHESNAVAGCA